MSLIKALIIGVLAWSLAGCGAVRLSYNNGPQLAWWWIDGYVDFDRDHATQVRAAIGRWFDWHRTTQLPGYASLLAEVGREMAEPTTAARACRWQSRMRDALDPAIARAIDLAVDLVPGLGAGQLKHLELRYAKSDDDFREDHLQPDPGERARAAVKRYRERAERVYGSLDDAQKRVIAAGVAASPYDPEALLAERMRRHRDTLQVLRRLVAERADRDQRVAALRSLTARAEVSADPAYRAYQAKLSDYNCELSARIHNAATPAQRRRAQETIKGWEDDLRALASTPNS